MKIERKKENESLFFDLSIGEFGGLMRRREARTGRLEERKEGREERPP